MLSDALKKDIILAVEHGENKQDFLLNTPVPNEDLPEYATFWDDVARVSHLRPTPTNPSLETPYGEGVSLGFENP